MKRLYPRQRDGPVVIIRDGQQSIVKNLVCEIGLFSAYYQGQPVTEFNGYAGYLIRSKPASDKRRGYP